MKARQAKGQQSRPRRTRTSKARRQLKATRTGACDGLPRILMDLIEQHVKDAAKFIPVTRTPQAFGREAPETAPETIDLSSLVIDEVPDLLRFSDHNPQSHAELVAMTWSSICRMEIGSRTRSPIPVFLALVKCLFLGNRQYASDSPILVPAWLVMACVEKVLETSIIEKRVKGGRGYRHSSHWTQLREHQSAIRAWIEFNKQRRKGKKKALHVATERLEQRKDTIRAQLRTIEKQMLEDPTYPEWNVEVSEFLELWLQLGCPDSILEPAPPFDGTVTKENLAEVIGTMRRAFLS